MLVTAVDGRCGVAQQLCVVEGQLMREGPVILIIYNHESASGVDRKLFGRRK